jgi:hypothetical protein
VESVIVRNVTNKDFLYSYTPISLLGPGMPIETRTGPGEGVDSEDFPEMAEALREHNAKHCPQETKKWMPKVYLPEEEADRKG